VIETVLFDLDGTLTDPAVGITRSLAHAFAAVGRPVPGFAALRGLIGPPLVDAFGSMGLHTDEIDGAIAAYRERYVETGMFENALVPGIEALLDELVSAGVRLAIATSKPEPFAVTILEHFAIADRFDAIAGATLDQRRRHKDEVVLHALELLGLPPAPGTVMVGDREHDVHGAAEHDVRTVGVLWGYGPRAELEAAGAWRVVETPVELRDVLLG
jgi:phosphoglycolate phosphatase